MACAGAVRTPGPSDRCGPAATPFAERLERVRIEAQAWLKLVEKQPARLYDAPGAPAPALRAARFSGTDAVLPLALVSYPGVGAESPLRGRSFLYDQALALLWFTWIGDEATARGLAATLVQLQQPDDSWGFAFGAVDGYYNASYVRSGAVAWATHALAHYARRYADRAAQAAADRAGRRFERVRRGDGPAGAPGLIEGGRGRWSPDEKTFFPDFRLRTAVTEHQLDVHMAWRTLQHPEVAALGQRILDTLWLDGEGRFAVAADDSGPDPARALDAAGGWGALWLLAQGDTERAGRSLRYTARAFAVTRPRLRGFRPYLDPVEGASTRPPPDLIFVEGTLGLGLAAHRLGESWLARATVEAAVELACQHGPGVPYADRPAPGFPVEPAAAPTLWFLFLEREMRTGMTAPLWPPALADGRRP
jgi:hypothetical protein